MIDESLGGGPRARTIVEAVGKGRRLSLALSVLAKATQQKKPRCSLMAPMRSIQGRDGARNLICGVCFGAQVKNGNSALRAADLTLGAGGVSLIVLPGRGCGCAAAGADGAVVALQHRAQGQGGALVVTEKAARAELAVGDARVCR